MFMQHIRRCRLTMLNCKIVTPDKLYFQGQANMVVVPGINGSLGFLTGHVPYVCPLGVGNVYVSDTLSSADGKCFKIQGGYVEFKDDNVIILAEHVE